MTAPVTEAPAKPPKQVKPAWFYVRNVRFCNDKAGNPVLEMPLSGRGIHLIHAEDKEVLELLKVVGISCHDGGKFFLGDKPMEFDKYTAVDFQVEATPGLNGRKITSVKQLKLDGMPAGGLTDAEFMSAWDKASDIVPPLKTVAADPSMWLPRVNRIVVEFYGQNGYGRDKGQIAADVIEAGIKAANMSGDIPFAQAALKNRLREEFPEGKPVPPKKFDVEGHQADIGMLIADEASNRKPFRVEVGKPLENFILGTSAIKFVTDEAAYDSAKGLVSEFFKHYDLETDLLKGIAANEKDTEISIEDLGGILKDVLNAHEAATTFDIVQLPDYDVALILAAHASAIEAFKTRDIPRFENGIKDQSDADTLSRLNNTDIKTDETPPPDEAAKASEPTPPPAEKPAFTAEEWSQWVDTMKRDYKELSNARVSEILGITRASEWLPRTLKDAHEKIKQSITASRSEKLIADCKRILKDKGLPLEEWVKIVVEIGDPKLYVTSDYEQQMYQEKVVKFANAYVVAHASDNQQEPPKQDSSLVPVSNAITPPEPTREPYTVLAALHLPTPAELQVMTALAEPIATARLFAGVDTTARAIVVMLKALQWGVGAVDALENFYVFPTQRGDVIYPSTKILKARVMAHPKCKKFDVFGDDKKATAIVWREGDEAPVTFTYTIEEAETAELLGKKNWKTNKGDMLGWRVSRRAIFAKFPDLALGLGDEE